MSRIGKIPLEIPKSVKVAVNGQTVNIEGPKGKLSHQLPQGVSIEQKENKVLVSRHRNDKQSAANHGTVRAIIRNMMIGVSEGHKKNLEIQGVGFRVAVQGDKLVMNLGFSHQIEYVIPKTVKLTAAKPTEIAIEGTDKEVVGQVAAEIRSKKPPEPYKGKGIRYAGEVVKRKQGKSVTK
jgi:large subunit ribosomal protein L6